jgi:hypothetical protein
MPVKVVVVAWFQSSEVVVRVVAVRFVADDGDNSDYDL